MNWLAHLYLSDSDPAMRVGSVLPDFVSAAACKSLPDSFQRGIRLHHRIDAFTDSHPIVRQSVARFRPPLRRFGGILTDLFYDHFLARDWTLYSSEPLASFIHDAYQSFSKCRHEIPADARGRFEQMQSFDWLGSYRELSGLAETLKRIASRFQRPTDLSGGMVVLEENYDSFAADFAGFFPELRSHVADYLSISQ